MKDPFIEVNHLTYRYPDGTTAIKNLSLTINKGRKIALLGKNGAGKSTLLQHLNGILRPTTGSILVNGEKMNYRRKDLLSLRQKVGIVFQNPDAQLFAGNVKQDISFGPHNLGWSKAKIEQQVEQAMEQTEVTSLQDRPIHFLSLGQKKRVAIAGVLAMEPDLFILDEPTAGLDAYYSKQIMDILHSIQRADRTILLSTHDIDFAYEWADEIIVMDNGEILYHGDPISIFHQEDLLTKAHLDKPWVFEVAQKLSEKKLLNEDRSIPRNKDELFQRL